MADRIAVIGLGIIGREITIYLSRKGYSVLAIDKRVERVETAGRWTDRAIILDATDEKALEDVNIGSVETAVCTIGAEYIKDSILVTSLLKGFGIPRIIARASDELHERILRQVGATEIFNPEKDTGLKIAARIMRPDILELIPVGNGVSISEIIVPESFVGKSIFELELRKKYNVSVVVIKRMSREGGNSRKTESILNVKPELLLEERDRLIVVGEDEAIERLSKLG